MEIKWWNLPVEIIKKNIELFRKDIDLELLKEIKQRLHND